MKLIVGLGNPGKAYEGNRHNIGFMSLKHLARTYGINLSIKQGGARIGRGIIIGIDRILARPQTCMNMSGNAVLPRIKKFEIDLVDLLIVHDDLDLPLGKIRISKDSGSGGHKGIDSIILHLGSREFSGLRIGIGRPDTNEQAPIAEEDIINYVLGDFSEREKNVILPLLPVVTEAIACFIVEGVYSAMNKFNQKK